MSEPRTLVVTIRGQEFRIRSAEDPGVLERIAAYVDETMGRVEKETRTVDSLDVSMLTSLNLAREALEARDRADGRAVEAERLRSLIELAESALDPAQVR